MGGLMDGWVGTKALLRIAYSNQKDKNGPIFKNQASNFLMGVKLIKTYQHLACFKKLEEPDKSCSG